MSGETRYLHQVFWGLELVDIIEWMLTDLRNASYSSGWAVNHRRPELYLSLGTNVDCTVPTLPGPR